MNPPVIPIATPACAPAAASTLDLTAARPRPEPRRSDVCDEAWRQELAQHLAPAMELHAHGARTAVERVRDLRRLHAVLQAQDQHDAVWLGHFVERERERVGPFRVERVLERRRFDPFREH
jgi:hypothetical protein